MHSMCFTAGTGLIYNIPDGRTHRGVILKEGMFYPLPKALGFYLLPKGISKRLIITAGLTTPSHVPRTLNRPCQYLLSLQTPIHPRDKGGDAQTGQLTCPWS